MEETEELLAKVEDKIKFGQSLIEKLKPIGSVEGVLKLQRKIKQEIVFLKKLQLSRKVKEEQLSCSNLRHLAAMVDCALSPNVQSVCKTFHFPDGNKINIDIISENGKVWTKVVARNPKSLSALSQGNASYGARSVLDQARDYVECAAVHPFMYQPPQVFFQFMSGIEDFLAIKLKDLGVIVKGEVIETNGKLDCESDEDTWDSDESDSVLRDDGYIHTNVNCDESHLEINTLNLDVTAMMAYVSNMTNGQCHFVFQQSILTQQAAWESQRPVKPVLDDLFEGKKLVCCQTAWDDFLKIVNTLGGEMEKRRTKELQGHLTILPDDTGGLDDSARSKLKVRGRVRLRSKIVFNFGHRIKALTVSANEGFVRAAQQQGLSYAAFIHESRALTEGKEATGEKIQS